MLRPTLPHETPTAEHDHMENGHSAGEDQPGAVEAGVASGASEEDIERENDDAVAGDSQERAAGQGHEEGKGGVEAVAGAEDAPRDGDEDEREQGRAKVCAGEMEEGSEASAGAGERAAPVVFGFEEEPEIAEFPCEVAEMKKERARAQGEGKDVGADGAETKFALVEVFQAEGGADENARRGE